MNIKDLPESRLIAHPEEEWPETKFLPVRSTLSSKTVFFEFPELNWRDFRDFRNN